MLSSRIARRAVKTHMHTHTKNFLLKQEIVSNVIISFYSGIYRNIYQYEYNLMLKNLQWQLLTLCGTFLLLNYLIMHKYLEGLTESYIMTFLLKYINLCN